MEETQDALPVLLQTAEKMIQRNEIQPALEFLERLDEQQKIGISQDLIMQSGNFYQVYDFFKQGMIDDDKYFQRTARIRFALTDIVKDIPRKLEMNARIKGLGAYQFKIPANPAELEKIIGSKDNLLTINWLEKALNASKSVCRIVLANGVKGTGFLTKDGYLFTNHHVIDSPESAKGARAEFNYEVGPDGSIRPLTSYQLDASSFVTSPVPQLDFTRVKLVDNPANSFKQWGGLDVAPDALPSPGDPVTIIQHPGGMDKRIALRANEVLQVSNQYVHYTTDTEGGSSGSPVFNNFWQVVAIHHAGKPVNVNGQQRDANEGILFRDIYAFIAKQ
ncbi:MAG TPA: trypsin-like peptidase domain-containing protein [Saprospiraceae bacterium]|nr:trypsin-like peptidase domain-containing protein [Saprospiraceae bacterium]HPI07715.1 trypsin-like peptidase domain-containing protein [Saprospiraceae bacterium]